jgi:trimethylamine:corrinoid methyltransferase-like protein
MSHRSWVDAGRPTAVETARELARQAIAEHRPVPLPDATVEKLRALVAAADQRAGLG